MTAGCLALFAPRGVPVDETPARTRSLPYVPPHIHRTPPFGGLLERDGPARVVRIVVGGMPGWQISLIAVVAAVLAAVIAVVLDRARADDGFWRPGEDAVVAAVHDVRGPAAWAGWGTSGVERVPAPEPERGQRLPVRRRRNDGGDHITF